AHAHASAHASAHVTHAGTGTDRMALAYFDAATPYETVWQRQQALVAARIADEIGDTLLMGQHPPTITLGRGHRAPVPQAEGFAVVAVDRGGQATVHAPGQLVAYPIMKLPDGRRDLHGLMRQLEAALIATLADFGITGQHSPPPTAATPNGRSYTGVWVGARKIASIGLGARQWVTYHGLALNVTTDLHAFDAILPCGFAPSVMTRMVDANPALHAQNPKPLLDAVATRLTDALLEGLLT
ncbi:MAG: lipoyl(octanoyl) transferase LipB, partial [Cyanobacteria bacterium HKST-UBA03]|nr:lipoyl(octanoyl) transferase LipB [Cyanobacteria bacterium HKST-UBA03]